MRWPSLAVDGASVIDDRAGRRTFRPVAARSRQGERAPDGRAWRERPPRIDAELAIDASPRSTPGRRVARERMRGPSRLAVDGATHASDERLSPSASRDRRHGWRERMRGPPSPSTARAGRRTFRPVAARSRQGEARAGRPRMARAAGEDHDGGEDHASAKDRREPMIDARAKGGARAHARAFPRRRRRERDRRARGETNISARGGKIAPRRSRRHGASGWPGSPSTKRARGGKIAPRRARGETNIPGPWRQDRAKATRRHGASGWPGSRRRAHDRRLGARARRAHGQTAARIAHAERRDASRANNSRHGASVRQGSTPSSRSTRARDRRQGEGWRASACAGLPSPSTTRARGGKIARGEHGTRRERLARITTAARTQPREQLTPGASVRPRIDAERRDRSRARDPTTRAKDRARAHRVSAVRVSPSTKRAIACAGLPSPSTTRAKAGRSRHGGRAGDEHSGPWRQDRAKASARRTAAHGASG